MLSLKLTPLISSPLNHPPLLYELDHVAPFPIQSKFDSQWWCETYRGRAILFLLLVNSVNECWDYGFSLSSFWSALSLAQGFPSVDSPSWPFLTRAVTHFFPCNKSIQLLSLLVRVLSCYPSSHYVLFKQVMLAVSFAQSEINKCALAILACWLMAGTICLLANKRCQVHSQFHRVGGFVWLVCEKKSF